jgi:hypothetical protein
MLCVIVTVLMLYYLFFYNADVPVGCPDSLERFTLI